MGIKLRYSGKVSAVVVVNSVTGGQVKGRLWDDSDYEKVGNSGLLSIYI